MQENCCFCICLLFATYSCILLFLTYYIIYIILIYSTFFNLLDFLFPKLKSLNKYRQLILFQCYYLPLLYFRRRQWQPTPVLLLSKSHGRRSLMGYSPWVTKSWTLLSNFTFTFHFHASKKEMATHSSVLAWRIPGTGEPGGLPSMGWHRVRHD